MYTLPKSERIHLKKEIDELFAQGKGFVAYPLRVVYRTEPAVGAEGIPPAVMLVSVGKKYFKRANKRNRVKRLVREAYRLNKHKLWEMVGLYGLSIRLAFMFVGKDLPSYSAVEGSVQKAFSRIAKELNQIHDNL